MRGKIGERRQDPEEDDEEESVEVVLEHKKLGAVMLKVIRPVYPLLRCVRSWRERYTARIEDSWVGGVTRLKQTTSEVFTLPWLCLCILAS